VDPRDERRVSASKHAEASSAVVRLAESDGWLAFVVEHDGRGFDPGGVVRGSGLQVWPIASTRSAGA
jgi:glucose-6-phosphate-specific signal transduction histidine kinase